MEAKARALREEERRRQAWARVWGEQAAAAAHTSMPARCWLQAAC